MDCPGESDATGSKASSEKERRLGAIMFTDMVGYTALTQTDESLAIDILEKHNRLLRPIFSRYHGREIKTMGDSFLVEFESALDATNCAVTIQKYLHDYNFATPGNWNIKLRIGVHLGDVLHTDSDVLGDLVNIASRIEPLADPEGVCISRQVYDQIWNKFHSPIAKLENKNLKNVQFSTDVFKVVMPWEEDRNWSKQIEEDASHRLAVLPFANMSPSPEDEFFADGLTEELIAELAGIDGLKVIARTSVMHYKNTQKTISEIGKELRVQSLLEGSVRKSGNKIRITAQLINSKNEEHLWAARFDKELNDIFAVQGEIAGNIAESLQLKLLKARENQSQRPKNLEAYTLCLKGRFFDHKDDLNSLKKALELYQSALSIEPGYPLAYAGLARCYTNLLFLEYIPFDEGASKTKMYAEKAIESDPSLAEAHLSLGYALNIQSDYAGAEREFRRALELNPNLAPAYVDLGGLYLSGAKMFFEREKQSYAAEQSYKRALELDPLSVETCSQVGTGYLYLRHYDKAIELLKNVLELDPTSSFARHNLGLAFVQIGRIDEGIKEMKLANEGRTPDLRSPELAYAYVKAGMIEEARAILSTLLNNRGQGRGLSVAIGLIYASLGEADSAFKWFEKAFDERSRYLQGISLDFITENLKSEPRFLELMKKMLPMKEN